MDKNSTAKAIALINKARALRNARRSWESHWQELADYMRPGRADFLNVRPAGEKRTDQIFDGTALQAARDLATALDGLLKPRTSRWFSLKLENEALLELPGVATWLSEVEEKIWNAIYDPEARFIATSGEVDDDLVVFGTGAMFVGEREDMSGLSFRPIHLRDFYIAENAEGVIDMAICVRRLTAKQAASMFDPEKLGADIRDVLTSNDEEALKEKFEFLQIVTPRTCRDPYLPDAPNMKFQALTVDVTGKCIVEESGFAEFPFIIPRWRTITGEIYGRSPAMLALPDAKSLNAMAKTILEAGQKSVNPPLLVESDGVVGDVRLWPGGLTHIDSSRISGNRNPLSPLNIGANIPLGLELENQRRKQITSAFFSNLLSLPLAGPQMTATEVIQRGEDFIRAMGPIFARLEAEYTAPLIKRIFGIMKRAGSLPPPPPILQGMAIRFDYDSPVTRVRKRMEVAAAMQTANILEPLAKIKPDLFDHFDLDRMTRDIAKFTGFPANWLKDRVQVDAVRAEREVQMQATQGVQEFQEIAKGLKDAVPALDKLEELNDARN